MKPPRLSDSLRNARESRGLSQRVVADEIGVTRTAITQIENGNRKVSTLELSKLAHLYRHSIQDLLNEKTPHESQNVFAAVELYAPELRENSKAQTQLEDCLKLCIEGVRLKRLVMAKDRLSPPSYDISNPRSIGEAVLQAENVAEQERRRIGFGHAPIVDISSLVAQQGIWVSSVKLPDEVSGMFVRHPDIDVLMLANSSHVRSRMRFSIAHEYAHSLLDPNYEIRVSSKQNSVELTECRANAFAASFLMPKTGVFEVLQRCNKGFSTRHEQSVFDVAGEAQIDCEIRNPSGSQQINHKDVATLAYYYGVSYPVALFRLKGLRYISSPESAHLLDQERYGLEYLKELKMLEDLEETEQIRRGDLEIQREVTHLAIEGYRRELISRGRLLELAKMLGVSGQVLVRLADAARNA